MQKPQDLIIVGHTADPRVPSGIQQTVSEADEDMDHHQDGIRWMETDDGISDDGTSGSDHGYASLTESKVDLVVAEGGQKGADEG